MPGLSPSGGYWRCNVTPISNILRSHGAMALDFHRGSANYTSGTNNEYFGWVDAKEFTARELAQRFLVEFADIAEVSRGRDWEYAGWYTEMLGLAEQGELPVAYADWWEEPDPRWLPTTKGMQSGLPMPPPGEAELPPEGTQTYIDAERKD